MATKVYLCGRYAGMNRDMDLVRALLARIEEDDRLSGAEAFAAYEFEMPGHSAEEVGYYVLLLLDAGFLEGNSETSTPMIERLTWEGCEFLDNTRDPEIWEKAKERAKRLGGIGVTIFLEVVKAEIKKKLGLGAG
jgi:hypothetical protein